MLLEVAFAKAAVREAASENGSSVGRRPPRWAPLPPAGDRLRQNRGVRPLAGQREDEGTPPGLLSGKPDGGIT